VSSISPEPSRKTRTTKAPLAGAADFLLGALDTSILSSFINDVPAAGQFYYIRMISR
jgi:hypothetical protein